LSIAVSAGTKKANKDFNFNVRENRQKWLSLGLFSVLLFLLGFIAGRVFTGSPATGFFICGVFNVLLAVTAPVRAENSAALEVGEAIVGQPSEIRWHLTNGDSVSTDSGGLTLRITHLEKNKTVFAVERIATGAAWTMRFHFPDAGAYRINTIARIAERPALTNEKLVQVAAVEPPLSASIPSIGYFIALIAAGLGVGRWSKRVALRSRRVS
jgi:hypothetical protein